MKALKILTVVSLLAASTLSASAYTAVKCSTDPVFAANSCNECFVDKARGEGSHLGELKDEWINNSTTDKIFYKIEQEMPKMVNLAPSLVSWKQDPSAKNFWEYAPELNSIYDKEDEGYKLQKGKKVTWIKSKKGYTYTLEKNKAAEGKNIGLLTYLITTHNISDAGVINTDPDEHKECVLFKSGKKVEKAPVIAGKTPTKNTPAKKLPKTGPEHYILLLLLAMILGFGVMKIRNKA